jgi:hypothetical protein
MDIYKTRGNVSDADCLIGLSYGTSIGKDSVNRQLADVMLQYSAGRPMIADRTLVDAFPDGDSQMAHVVEGAVTNVKAQGVGTWGTLVEASEYMHQNGLSRPVMIAQAYHIKRAVKQARRLGIDPVVPEGLPKDFDKNSEQIWTRSRYLWTPINALSSVLLKIRRQL